MNEKQTKEVFEVNNIAEYIGFISKQHESVRKNFLYRGEKSDADGNEFSERLAGAFRNPNQYGYHINFMNTIDNYRTEISHRITDHERQEFLAFSQHHGLKTNLLDVTFNPLIALFFACHGEDNDNSSYVYIFDTMNYDKVNYIDISEILYTDASNENLLEVLMSGDYFSLQKMQNIIKRYFRRHRLVMKFQGDSFIMKGLGHINSIMFNLYTYAREIYRKNGMSNNKQNVSTITVEELFNSCPQQALGGHISGGIIDGEDYFKELLERLIEEPELRGFNVMTPQQVDLSLYYILFLYYCITVSYPNIDSDVFKYFLPPMIYKPKVKFDRLKNQQGCFIYQPYSYSFDIDKIKLTQNISEDYTLKINNTQEILKDLDALNINIATMYNDYDSVATYVQGKR
jgi:hypothetical protein